MCVKAFKSCFHDIVSVGCWYTRTDSLLVSYNLCLPVTSSHVQLRHQLAHLIYCSWGCFKTCNTFSGHLGADEEGALLCHSGTDQVSYWWLLAILFLHLHLHLGHWLGHSQGQLCLRLQLLLSTQEVHVLQRLRVILSGVPVRVGRTLLWLRGVRGGRRRRERVG